MSVSVDIGVSVGAGVGVSVGKIVGMWASVSIGSGVLVWQADKAKMNTTKSAILFIFLPGNIIIWIKAHNQSAHTITSAQLTAPASTPGQGPP